MDNLRIFIQPGWAFSSKDWNEWERVFPKKCLLLQERGYFEPSFAEEKNVPIHTPYLVLVAHSLGLHLLPQELLRHASLLIICGGFIHFGNDKKTEFVLRMMQEKLSMAPQTVLKTFYESCFYPQSSPIVLPTSYNVPLLISDLKLLGNNTLDLSFFKTLPKILIFHGKEDQIVSLEKAKDLSRQLPTSELFLLENTGHGLFHTHAQMIGNIILQHYQTHQQTQKQKILSCFSKNASFYDRENSLHRKAASFLEDLFSQIDPKNIYGPILEIGAGTGLVTEKILHHFPYHPLEVSDISKEMLDIIKNKIISPHNQIKFLLLDGEDLCQKEKYGLIISGMTFQWFYELFPTIEKLVFSLKKGGKLIFSCQGDESFPEWVTVCEKEGLPLTKNPLPQKESLLEFAHSFDPHATVIEKKIQQDFFSPLDFFHWLKKRGASQATHKQFLSRSLWKKLLSKWAHHYPDKTTITHQILLVTITKKT